MSAARDRRDVLLQARAFDPEYYRAQLADALPDADEAELVAHYRSTGRQDGLAPHPLIEPSWVRQRGEVRGGEPTTVLLRSEGPQTTPHPLLDLAGWGQAHPAAAGHRFGVLGHLLDSLTADTVLPVAPRWGLEPLTYGQLRRHQLTPTGPPRGGSAGPVTAVLACGRRDALTAARSVARLLADGVGAAVVVVTNADPPAARMLHACIGIRPEVTITAAEPADLMTLVASPLVLVTRPGIRLAAPALALLVRELAEPGVAAVGPVVLDRSGQLRDGGLAWLGEDPAPHRVLAGHPPEDLAVRSSHQVAALSGDAVLLTRRAALGSGPLSVRDTLMMVEVCLRLREQGQEVRLVPGAVAHAARRSPEPRWERADLARFVDHRRGRTPEPDPAAWSGAGLTLVSGSDPPRVARARAAVTTGPGTGRPALRWAIHIAAPTGQEGDLWGEVGFADDLAAALRRLGQHVAVDRLRGHDRATARLDDVRLVLRGLAPMDPAPGPCRVLWVISHPDDVPVAEVREADLAFAAGAPWCAAMTARSGRPVTPLLQATDPDRFHPGAEPALPAEVLFVGSPRGMLRPVVRDALAVGAPLSLYGPGWRRFVREDQITADLLPNGELPGAYAHAGVVLNDHWPDMARWGFLSNRVLDAVASGARVVSDPVPGLAELFPGRVLTYRGAAELARLLADPDDAFAGEPAREAARRLVRAEYSFDARAATLLDAVCRKLAGAA
ncbi:MAG TPA: glycosyltransferase [Candidatus Nanopelagicales bacterium]|nr:glycosyltransferase [Candidatus Nanopelagicales bacterium]